MSCGVSLMLSSLKTVVISWVGEGYLFVYFAVAVLVEQVEGLLEAL